MARPRLPEKKLSKWGVWKRQQRGGERGSKCAECGATSNLVVDHKNGEVHDNRKSNKRTLCRKCHLRKHKEIAVKGGKARQRG